VTDESLSHITANHELAQNITSIDLDSCIQITDIGVKLLFKHCTNLENLSLNWNYNLTDNAFVTATRYMNLKTFSIAGCNKLSDNALRVLSYCRKIRILNIPAIQAITDAGIDNIITYCPNLHSLNITQNILITDKSLIQIVKSSPNLNRLDAAGCTKLTDLSLTVICVSSLNLQHLDISWCTQFSELALRSVITDLPRLQTLRMRSHGAPSFLSALQSLKKGVDIITG